MTPNRRATIALLAALTLALAALHLFLARHWTGPILYEDSLAYLAIARRFAGIRPPHPVDIKSFYHFGYSLLLAPLYFLLRTPQAVFRGALVLDALLGSLQLPLLYALGRRLLALERADALLAALAAALAGRRPPAIVAFALNAAFLVAIHPRGLGIAAVTAAALVLWGALGTLP